MRRVPKVVLAFALAFGWQLTPPAAQPAQAACGGSYCARLSLSLSAGAGSGYAYSIPFGLDCTDYGGGTEGVCTYEFTLAGPGGTDIEVYLAPGVGSYACDWTDTCGAIEQEIHRTWHLNPGNNTTVAVEFNAAPHHMALHVALSGNGTGRVTTPPLGIDCRLTTGAPSGTCSKDVYWINDTPLYSIVVDPADTSFVCYLATCRPPGETLTTPSFNATDGDAGAAFEFWARKPTKVSITGSGSVKSTPAGIQCPPTCSAFFMPDTAQGETTSFKATPAAGWAFKSWGGACAGKTGTTCSIAIAKNPKAISITFVRLATQAPTAKPTGRPTAAATAISSSAPTAGPSPSAGSSTTEPTPAASPTTSMPPSLAPADPTPAATRSTDPVVNPGTPGGIDPLVLALVAIIMVLLLALGFSLGRRVQARGPAGNGPA